MKKLASMFLVLALLLALTALAACAKEEPAGAPAAPTADAPATPTDTPAPAETAAPAAPAGEVTAETLDASKPNEYVPEKIAAGREVVIGFSLQSFQGVGKVVESRLQEEFPDMGLTLTVAVDDFDNALQITNIENFITMGCAAVLIHTADVTLLEDVVTKAEAAGTSCIVYGDIPTYPLSAYTCIDLSALGYSVGLLAREWISQTYPDAGEGEVKVAVHGSYAATPSIILSDNVTLAIQDDPRCVIVYSDNDVAGLDAGFNFAQQALTTNPDVRVFAGFSLQSAFGCSNYVMSLPGVNPQEYCSVGATYDVSAEDFLQAAERGEGIFRGCTAGNSDPAWGHLECIDAVLFRQEARPVIRMQEIEVFSNGLKIEKLLEQCYYGVYTR